MSMRELTNGASHEVSQTTFQEVHRVYPCRNLLAAATVSLLLNVSVVGKLGTLV